MAGLWTESGHLSRDGRNGYCLSPSAIYMAGSEAYCPDGTRDAARAWGGMKSIGVCAAIAEELSFFSSPGGFRALCAIGGLSVLVHGAFQCLLCSHRVHRNC